MSSILFFDSSSLKNESAHANGKKDRGGRRKDRPMGMNSTSASYCHLGGRTARQKKNPFSKKTLDLALNGAASGVGSCA